jgi:excisionase family DNA binding protein
VQQLGPYLAVPWDARGDDVAARCRLLPDGQTPGEPASRRSRLPDNAADPNIGHHSAVRRPPSSQLPPDIAAVAELLGRVRARIILEADHEQQRGDALQSPSDGTLAKLPPTRLLLRVEEVAEALALSRSAVYTLIRTGEIPAVKIGRSTRVSLESLRQWVRSRER